MVAELDQDEQALQSLPGTIERRFLEVGQILQEQTVQGDQLLKTSEALNRLTDNMLTPGHPITDSFSLVSSALDSIENGLNQAGQLHTALRTYQTRLEEVQKTEDDWFRLNAPLQIVQRLFRIEAASLPVESFSSFEALSERIAQLHHDVATAVHQQYESLRPACRQLDLLRAQLGDQIRSQSRALEYRAGLQATLAKLQEQIRRNSERQEELLRHSHNLSAHLGAVVVAIQYQDITRQKLEHIQAASRQIRQLCQAGSRFRIRQGPDARLADLSQACRIQAGQIQSVRDDLNQAQAAIQTGLRQILEDLAAMNGEAVSRGEVGEAKGGMEAITASLWENLTHAEELLAKSMASEQVAHQAADQFNQASSQVARSIRLLAEDIRLSSLNAQIAVNRVQTATGLEVLTQFTRQIAEETHQFSELLGRQMSEMNEGLRLLAQQCRQAQQQSLAESNRLTLQIQHHRQILISYRDEVQTLLATMAGQMTEISSNTHHLLPETEFGEFQQDRLQALQDSLMRIIQECQAQAHSGEVSSVSLEEFKRNYTMASERVVHDAVIREQKSWVQPSSRVDTRAEGAIKTESSEILPATAQVGKPAAGKTEIPASSQPSTSLGDNVELF